MSLVFRNAQPHEAQEIFALYKSMLGLEFCPWDDEYPSMTEIADDLNHNSLFVLTEDNQIIGTISVCPQNELDDFSCFAINCNYKEIGRICIKKECRGRGLSAFMVAEVFKILSLKGIKAIRISASVLNVPALKTYKKLGFEIKLQTHIYGGEYYLLEKIL